MQIPHFHDGFAAFRRIPQQPAGSRRKRFAQLQHEERSPEYPFKNQGQERLDERGEMLQRIHTSGGIHLHSGTGHTGKHKESDHHFLDNDKQLHFSELESASYVRPSDGRYSRLPAYMSIEPESIRLLRSAYTVNPATVLMPVLRLMFLRWVMTVWMDRL